MSTDIVVVMDRSGSMATTWDDAIGGFNTFLAEQQSLPDEAYLTLSYFDNEFGTFYKHMPLDAATPLTGKEFPPRGSTALLDAIGKAITTRDALPIKADKAVLVIITDGEENASREFDNDKIKTLITQHEATGKFTTIYIGANQDAFAVAGTYGIQMRNAATYDSHVGTKSAFKASSVSVSNLRFGVTGQSMQTTYDEEESKRKAASK